MKSDITITISSDVKLKPATPTDHQLLFDLMSQIYPPAYKHYWKDGGSWYINSQYSKDNLISELSESNQVYYFVLYKNEIVGILRLLFDSELRNHKGIKAIKLHRIYLHQKAQGLGLGKLLLNYTESIVKENNYQLLWLEVMEKQPQAFHFYKKLGFKIADKYTYDKELLFEEYRSMLAVYKDII